MTIDDAIELEIYSAESQELLAKRYDDASGYSRCHNEQIRTTEAKTCEKRAEEHRQIAEWLKELKEYKDKNEPKLVVYLGDGYADGHMVYDWAECPNCSFTIEESDADWEMPFCPSCGQALKWEVEE